MGEEDFKPRVGDIVELKSGGPPMTVADVDTNMLGHVDVKCLWFFGAMETKTFSPSVLKPSKAKPLDELRAMGPMPKAAAESEVDIAEKNQELE